MRAEGLRQGVEIKGQKGFDAANRHRPARRHGGVERKELPVAGVQAGQPVGGAPVVGGPRNAAVDVVDDDARADEVHVPRVGDLIGGEVDLGVGERFT